MWVLIVRIHCHAKSAVKNGKVAGLSRVRCRSEGCKRSYTALARARLSRLRFNKKWEAYQDCLRQRLTLEQAAALCGISKTTAFKWRHRFTAEAASCMPLEGVVEMDETYFLESEKGSHSLRQRRKPRKRGGETYASEIGTRQATRIESKMADWTASDSVVVSDVHPPYGIASNNLQRRHEVVNPRRDRYVRNSTWHLNTVNNRHEVMKSMLNHRQRDVATKYLDNYTNRFQRQELRPDKQVNINFLKDHVMIDTD